MDELWSLIGIVLIPATLIAAGAALVAILFLVAVDGVLGLTEGR